MPTFDVHTYQLFRPHYPHKVFDCLNTRLNSQSLALLELGVGTGISLTDLLLSNKKRIFSQITAIDRDGSMLEAAQKTHHNLPIDWVQSQINSNSLRQLSPKQYDLIHCASAWHWFYKELSAQVLVDLLRPEGLLFIHEYQFPHSQDRPELNAWAKLNFNRLWKPITQTPRGSLQQMTTFLKTPQHHPSFKEILISKQSMILKLTLNEYLGQLCSQSRFRDYFDTLTIEDQKAYLVNIESAIVDLWGTQNALEFDFKWSGRLFQKNT